MTSNVTGKTISPEEIKRIHEEFVLRNTLLDPVKVSVLLSCSVRTVFRLIQAGELEETNHTPGKQGTRISAWSVEQFRIRTSEKAAQYMGGK